MSSDNPNPEQAQAKIALALGRLRGDVMPPITSQAAPRLQDQPVTPSSVNPAAINAGSAGMSPGHAAPANMSSTSTPPGGSNFRADPTFSPSSASANAGPTISVSMSGPTLSSLNTNLNSGGLGNGAGVTSPVSRPQTQPSGSQYSAAPSGNAGGASYFGNINVDKDANQPDLLSGVDMGPPPLGDTYPRAEDGDARRKRNRRVVLIGAVAAVVVIVGFWIGTRHHGDVPVITADATPEKVKPADQGGLQVPNQNVQVLENMNGQPKAQDGETVLPPPEQPMAPPAPTGDQSGQGAAAAPATGGDQSLQAPPVPTPSAPTTSDATSSATAPSATGTSAVTPSVPAVPAVPDTNSSAMTSTAAIPAAPSASTTATTAPATPAATTTQQSAAKTTTAPAATPGGKVKVQLAAVKSEEAARSTWAKLQKAHPAQLGNLSLIIEKVDKGTAGIFYRVQAGPLADKTTAKSICSALTQQNQACLVAR